MATMGGGHAAWRPSPARIVDRSAERFRLVWPQHDYLHDGAVIDAAGVLARGGEHDGVAIAGLRIGRHLQQHLHFDGLVAP